MNNINTNFHILYSNNRAKNTQLRYDLYRYKWHNNPINDIVDDYPLFLDLDISTGCNLKCPHCYQTTKQFKHVFMTLKLFKKIMRQSKDVYGIKFHTIGRGEPLLNKRLPEMIKCAKDSGMIDVCLNTNGTLLTKELSDVILESGLDRISFSIDGHNHHSYKRNRNANFQDVMRNVKYFYKRAKNYNCRVRIQAVDVNLDKQMYVDVMSQTADEVAYIDYKDMKNKINQLESNWVCPQPWQRLSVLWTGDILPCNHDENSRLELGNLNSITIKDAWHCNKIRDIRTQHKNHNAHLLNGCNGCFLRTSEINKNKFSQGEYIERRI